MIRSSFNDGWYARPKVNPFAELSVVTAPFEPVAVPHDAMISRARRAPAGEADPGDVVAENAAAGAYFTGGVVEYKKSFFVPEVYVGKRVLLEFEGVYRDAVVRINGDYAGQRPYGYSRFLIDADRFLRCGQDNEIRVEARTHQDSRWYSGAGIYRDTWMLVGGPVRISPHGVRVTTADVDKDRAVVQVATTVENDSMAIRTVVVRSQVCDAAGVVVATDSVPLSVLPGEPATARQRLYVGSPELWSPETPALYTASVTLAEEDGDAVDTATTTFGVRSLRLDPVHGLRINGEPVKMRGACIHHDNGILGAATYARSEERRIRILKDAGFNAVRMAHHPMSPAMLSACDRLGMLVVDEAFDMWTLGKNGFDYHLSFPEWWERDLESMVAKDYNHPSVVMYSIGNEIPEVGSPSGAAWGRRLAEKVRALDDTRYVTNGINLMLAVWSDLHEWTGTADEGTGINTFMADPSAQMNEISASETATRRTAESFALLDVAGMNYADARYAPDSKQFPNRIILGTETFPNRIDANWQQVKKYGHVIGDFTWTGWDYLGEVGLGRPVYKDPNEPQPWAMTAFPHLLAGCGDIDITGHRRPASYYREIVFGLRKEPYIAVQRPEHHGQTYVGMPWSWSDTISSWTWPGFESRPIVAEVYSDADEVELLVNGRSLGRRPTGEQNRFRCAFDTVYEPGEVTAVAYQDGIAVGRTTLRSATGRVRLAAAAERPVVTRNVGDLAYVVISLTDAAGTVHTAADRSVRLAVSGAGVLAGFGSAEPSTEERFDTAEHRTYEGRALAVIRPTGTGEIRVLASAADCELVEVRVMVA